MTGIILSGGRNSRMGMNKAFLEIKGIRIIEHTVTLFKTIFDEVIIVTNEPLAYLDLGVTIVADIYPDKGVLGGLYTGLFYSRSDYAFVSGCDMPFLQADFIKYMISRAPGYDIVIPDAGDGIEPLHAVYGRSCLPAILNRLKQGKQQIREFFKGLRMHTLTSAEIDTFDPAHQMFINVNTCEDFQKIAHN